MRSRQNWSRRRRRGKKFLQTPIAANLLKAVEEDDPENKIDLVVQHHPDDLRDERHAIFHRGQQVRFPEREQEGQFTFHV